MKKNYNQPIVETMDVLCGAVMNAASPNNSPLSGGTSSTDTSGDPIAD
jgi:hypothetical protein